MAPIRRYLRITRYSVLEVRIYLETPSLASSWLLSSRSPALPRIMAAVRPLVLPKLREELENSKRKAGKKRKATKDVVEGEDFEVSVFLTDKGSGHAILTKRKTFGEGRVKGGNKLGVGTVRVLLEEDDEEVRIEDIPAVGEGEAIDVSSGEDEFGARGKRKRGVEEEEDGPDKKKLGLRTGYEGFSIYKSILCLIVKRKGGKAAGNPAAGGSAMLENWVSTQMDKEGIINDDDG